MPPGAAKSTYASVLFPAHFLVQHPSASIISASHTTELSERWGRRVRNSILEHGPTLGLSLRSDSQAAGRWQLVSGGEYLSAGVGQAILGFRAQYPLEGDRRVAFMILDQAVVAVSPSSVYRALDGAGLTKRHNSKPPLKGKGVDRPAKPQEH